MSRTGERAAWQSCLMAKARVKIQESKLRDDSQESESKHGSRAGSSQEQGESKAGNKGGPGAIAAANVDIEYPLDGCSCCG